MYPTWWLNGNKLAEKCPKHIIELGKVTALFWAIGWEGKLGIYLRHRTTQNPRFSTNQENAHCCKKRHNCISNFLWRPLLTTDKIFGTLFCKSKCNCTRPNNFAVIHAASREWEIAQQRESFRGLPTRKVTLAWILFCSLFSGRKGNIYSSVFAFCQFFLRPLERPAHMI